MGNANLNLDEINESDALGTKEPAPEGWYMLRVVDSEIRETKAGTGQYVSYEFEIVDLPGKKHWENYNFENPSEVAQRIARAQLKCLAKACGKAGGTLSDFAQLHGKVFDAKLRILPAQNGYGPKNQIAEYKAIEKQATPAPMDDDVPFA
jgi:hypothetical protein